MLDFTEINKFILETRNIPIVVEGKRDAAPLQKLGFKNILPISGTPLFDVVERVKLTSDTVVILTDYDREGRKLEGNLSKLFQHSGVKILSNFRRKFRSIFKVVQIEEIESLIKVF